MSIVIAGCWLKLGLKDDVVDGDVLILTEPVFCLLCLEDGLFLLLELLFCR